MNSVTSDDAVRGFVTAVNNVNCKRVLSANAERVEHFERRMVERGDDPTKVVIVVLDVDDVHGAALADALMPGHDWQAYRDRGERPIARGLAGREGITGAIEQIDPSAAAQLRGIAGPAVVCVSSEAVIVRAAREIRA
jgi:hypothetical protein